MKLLTAFVLIQIVILCVLFQRVMHLEDSLSDMPPPVVVTSTGESSPARAPRPQPPRDAGLADEEQLRAVIREELRAELADVRLRGDPATPADSQPAPQVDVTYDYRRETVEQDMEYYAQLGEIGPAEMAQLQADIAKLRPADRTAMLGRLVRELNTGALKGQP